MDKKELCEELIKNSQEKIELIQMIKELTQKQSKYLQSGSLEAFTIIAGNKKELIHKMDKLDDEFEKMYSTFCLAIKSKEGNENIAFEKLKESVNTIQKLIIQTQCEEENNFILYNSLIQELKKGIKNTNNKISEYNKTKKFSSGGGSDLK